MAKSYYCIYYSQKWRQRKKTTPATAAPPTPTPKGFMPTTGSNRCSNSCTPICLPGHAPNNMQHTKWAPISLKRTHTHTPLAFAGAAYSCDFFQSTNATHSLAHNDDEHWAWMKTKLIRAKQCLAIGVLPSLALWKGTMGTGKRANWQRHSKEQLFHFNKILMKISVYSSAAM